MRKMVREKKEDKFYSLMNDFAFKWVFGQASNSKILIRLLNTVLGLEKNDRIVELTHLNPFNYSSYKNEKYSIVDTRVQDGHGNLYNIEVQNVHQDGFGQRSLYYLSKLYSGQLVEGQDYANLKPAIGISLMNFDLFEDSSRIHEIFTFKNVFNHKDLSDSMILHFIDLTKFDTEKSAEKRTALEKWLHVLRFSEEYAKTKEKVVEQSDDGKEGKAMLDCREITDDEAIRLAVNELHKINANPETRAHLEACDRYVRDMALTRGYAYNKGFKDRQPEVDAANKRADEAEQEAVKANLRADQEKARADEERARADKIKADTDTDREKIINNLKSIGLTQEQIANAMNV